MTHHHLNEAVPTVVLHLVAAGMNVAAALSLGAPAPGLFSAAVVAVALGGPFLAIALGVSGRERVGAGVLAGSYFGAAALGLYSLVGLGVLSSVLQTPQETGWRAAYFLTAALLPLLQIKGILEAGSTLLPAEDDETKGRQTLEAAVNFVAQALRSIKQDTATLELQRQFYERADRPDFRNTRSDRRE